MKKAKKIVGIVIIVTFILAMIYMGYGIYTLLDPRILTSFPWTFAIVLTGFYFGPLLLLEVIVYFILRWQIKKRNIK